MLGGGGGGMRHAATCTYWPGNNAIDFEYWHQGRILGASPALCQLYCIVIPGMDFQSNDLEILKKKLGAEEDRAKVQQN